MASAPLPPDEPARLEALKGYEVLDTPPEAAFDTLATLAADIFLAPVALVSFIAEERQWFKAHIGIEVSETPRTTAFCAHTILSNEVMVIPDATKDERFFDNPDVTGGPAVRFYAGAPLVTPAGQRIGSLCVLGTKARDDVTPAQRQVLSRLATLVVDELELRKALRDAATWQKNHRRSELMVRSVFDAVNVGICICDEAGNFIEVNEAYCRLSGYSAEELLGNLFTKTVPPSVRKAAFEAHLKVIRGESPPPREGKMQRKDGSVLPLWITGELFESPDGRRHRVASLTDVSEIKKLHEQLEHMAFYDALTGLPNRAYMQGLLAREMEKKRSGKLLAVLQLDLDNFKIINDTRGHEVGDGVLVEVGKRLRQALRAGDTLTRWAGDEFFIVATLEGVEQAERLADRLLATFKQPFWVNGYPLRLSASVGVTVQQAAAFDGVESLKQADLALHRAKETGSAVAFFTQELQSSFSDRHALEQDLRDAIETSSLALFYQPRVDMVSERWLSVEALLRWQHPTRGMISPATFIPLAEESGLILGLGALVLDKVCEQASRWNAAGTPLRVAVNVSARQLVQDDFIDTVLMALERYRLPAHLLELEVTESAFMLDVEASIAKLRELQRHGLLIAMDDFGTGYSSLNALTQLPLNALKIDKSFVDRVAKNMSKQDRVVIEMVVALGNSLGLELIAEGVETAEQQQYLLKRGCARAQGYLFARPAPAHVLTARLEADPTLRGVEPA